MAYTKFACNARQNGQANEQEHRRGGTDAAGRSSAVILGGKWCGRIQKQRVLTWGDPTEVMLREVSPQAQDRSKSSEPGASPQGSD